MSTSPKRGRPPHDGESESFYLTVPKAVHAYLLHLARDSYAGSSVGEVAGYLLKIKLAELGAKLDVPDKL